MKSTYSITTQISKAENHALRLIRDPEYGRRWRHPPIFNRSAKAAEFILKVVALKASVHVYETPTEVMNRMGLTEAERASVPLTMVS
jgi:hypothetical protein